MMLTCAAFSDNARFAERNGEIRARIFGAVVGLAVEMFVLEEHDGIVAANGGAKKAGDVERGGRHNDAQAGAVREDRFAALAVVHGSAGEIATDGDANHGGTLEIAIGAPTHDAKFIANLHHGGPDVIEELDFGDWLQSASGHADGAANDTRFGKRRVEDAIRAIFALQASGGFEDAALPFYFAKIFLAAGIGNIFAEDSDAIVTAHFIVESGGDHFDHGLGAALKFWFSERIDGRGGVHIRRVDVIVDGRSFGRFGGKSLVGSFADFAIDFRFEGLDLLLIDEAFADEE